MPTRRRVPTARWALPLALAVLAAAPAAALAFPAQPSAPANNAFVPSVRPTFSWTAGTVAAGDRYEIHIATDGIGEVAESPAGSPRTAQASVDLPDDRSLRWFVRIVHLNGALPDTTEDTDEEDRRNVRISTPAPSPAITDGPAGPSASPTPTFAWSGTRVSSTWTLTDPAGAALQTASLGTPSGQATMAPLADGDYVFRVVQRNLEGKTSPQALRPFSVDTVAPGPLAITPGQGTPSTTPSPSFRWTGVEAGGSSAWRVTGTGGVAVQGPTPTAATDVVVGPLGAGSYVFEARQSDAAGNAGPWQTEPFAVLPTPAAPPGTTSVRGRITLPTRNTRLLRPRVGARVSSRRPILRWRGAPRSVRLFNVQLFRVVGATAQLRKVHSAFPTATRYRVPARARLAPGACYVWRVWPYKGRSFTKTPLGVSNFCVAAKK